MDKYRLQDLNEAQQRAVRHGDGPLLVIAGAGSGKTRVLTYRIAYLLREKHIPPHQILAVTFTNKAAKEMKERLVGLVGPTAQRVWMGTFHSTCVQILRSFADRLGYTRNFSIFDTSDQLVTMRETLKELNVDPKKFEPRAVLGSISAAKNELIGVEEYASNSGDFWERSVARLYAAYQKKLQANDAMDFDDLIMQTVRLFETQPDVLALYRERFRYCLVDEYQDTNKAQYHLISLLAGESANICVVGDADQSIYRFRGADIRNILDFERDFPGATLVKLEQNYRSTKNILEAANSLIKNNMDRPEKTLFTENPAGDPVTLYRAADERGEAGFVADEIGRLADEGVTLGDITILYRTHAQSRTFEEEFVRRGTPYRIVSGVRFYERKEIKDILAYLRVVANPADNFSMRRIINVPKRGIGDTTIARLEDYAARQGISLYEAMAHARDIEKISASTAKKVLEVWEWLAACISQRDKVSLTELTEHLMHKSGYMAALKSERSLEADARIENLREFLSVTKQFETVELQAVRLAQELGPGLVQESDEAASPTPEAVILAFLEHVALVSDVDAYDEDAAAVTLMTLHSAKGLEFPVVFLVGMEEGVFPHARALWDHAELEEERRLAYVGMTRAMRRLYLTCARQRMLYGQITVGEPSRFIGEVPEHLIKDLQVEHHSRLASAHRRLVKMGLGSLVDSSASVARKAPAVDETSASKPALTYTVGERLQHDKFGIGTVVSVADSQDDQILTIAFPGEGVKKLMASMAPLVRIK
jgi:DNA helicase-2/ATP-dependent DNA helicase PcrA